VLLPETPDTSQDPEEFIMVTTKTKSATDITKFAEQAREQLLTSVKQFQQLTTDAAQSWVKAVSVFPTADLSAFTDIASVPGVPALPSVEAATKYTFDVVTDLLNAQREFALQLTSVLVPEKLA
jgi:hypothetical protein